MSQQPRQKQKKQQKSSHINNNNYGNVIFNNSSLALSPSQRKPQNNGASKGEMLMDILIQRSQDRNNKNIIDQNSLKDQLRYQQQYQSSNVSTQYHEGSVDNNNVAIEGKNFASAANNDNRESTRNNSMTMQQMQQQIQQQKQQNIDSSVKTTERKQRMSVSQIMNEDLAVDLKEQNIVVSCSSDGMHSEENGEHTALKQNFAAVVKTENSPHAKQMKLVLLKSEDNPHSTVAPGDSKQLIEAAQEKDKDVKNILVSASERRQGDSMMNILVDDDNQKVMMGQSQRNADGQQTSGAHTAAAAGGVKVVLVRKQKKQQVYQQSAAATNEDDPADLNDSKEQMMAPNNEDYVDESIMKPMINTQEGHQQDPVLKQKQMQQYYQTQQQQMSSQNNDNPEAYKSNHLHRRASNKLASNATITNQSKQMILRQAVVPNTQHLTITAATHHQLDTSSSGSYAINSHHKKKQILKPKDSSVKKVSGTFGIKRKSVPAAANPTQPLQKTESGEMMVEENQSDHNLIVLGTARNVGINNQNQGSASPRRLDVKKQTSSTQTMTLQKEEEKKKSARSGAGNADVPHFENIDPINKWQAIDENNYADGTEVDDAKANSRRSGQSKSKQLSNSSSKQQQHPPSNQSPSSARMSNQNQNQQAGKQTQTVNVTCSTFYDYVGREQDTTDVVAGKKDVGNATGQKTRGTAETAPETATDRNQEEGERQKQDQATETEILNIVTQSQQVQKLDDQSEGHQSPTAAAAVAAEDAFITSIIGQISQLYVQKMPVNVQFHGSGDDEQFPPGWPIHIPQTNDQNNNSQKVVLKKNKASFISRRQEQSPNNNKDERIVDPVTRQLMPKDFKSLEKHLREIETFYANRRRQTSLQQPQTRDAEASSPPSRNELRQILASSKKNSLNGTPKEKVLDQALSDEASRNTLNKVKKLFGESHAESRALLNELQIQMTRSKISVSQAEALKMSKKSKDVPVLDQLKFRVDAKVEQESKMNPLLVKQKPLALPKTVISHLKHLKAELRAKKDIDRLPVMTRVQSQKAMLHHSSSLSSGLSIVHKNPIADFTESEMDSSRFNHREHREQHEKSDPTLRKSDSQNTLLRQVKIPQVTPIYIGQQHLMKSSADFSPLSSKKLQPTQNKASPYKVTSPSARSSKNILNLSELKEMRKQLESSQLKDERKARAYIQLMRQDMSREATRKKALQSMKETRLIQSSLNAAALTKKDPIEALMAPVDDDGLANIQLAEQQLPQVMPNRSRRRLPPKASASVHQNTELLDSIIERIAEEQDAQKSSVKQISANRRIKNLAKQMTWQSTTTILQQRMISEQQKKASQTRNSSQVGSNVISRNDSTESLNSLIRAESSKRRLALRHFNEKIKTTNMEKIYKLKQSSQQSSQQSFSKQNLLLGTSSQFQQTQANVTQSTLKNASYQFGGEAQKHSLHIASQQLLPDFKQISSTDEDRGLQQFQLEQQQQQQIRNYQSQGQLITSTAAEALKLVRQLQDECGGDVDGQLGASNKNNLLAMASSQISSSQLQLNSQRIFVPASEQQQQQQQKTTNYGGEPRSSQQETESNKYYLPNIVIGGQSQPTLELSVPQSSGVAEEENRRGAGFDEYYQNLLMAETLDAKAASVSQPADTNRRKRGGGNVVDEEPGRIVQSVLSRRSSGNSDEKILSTAHPTTLVIPTEGGAGSMSLAELVNLQTQQMMMQFSGDQTGERWHQAEHLNSNQQMQDQQQNSHHLYYRNESASKATSYQTIGMAPSAQFVMTGNLGGCGYGTHSDENDNTPGRHSQEKMMLNNNTAQKLSAIFSPELDRGVNPASSSHQQHQKHQQQQSKIVSLPLKATPGKKKQKVIPTHHLPKMPSVNRQQAQMEQQQSQNNDPQQQLSQILMPSNASIGGKAPLVPNSRTSSLGKKLSRQSLLYNNQSHQQQQQQQTSNQIGVQLPSVVVNKNTNNALKTTIINHNQNGAGGTNVKRSRFKTIAAVQPIKKSSITNSILMMQQCDDMIEQKRASLNPSLRPLDQSQLLEQAAATSNAALNSNSISAFRNYCLNINAKVHGATEQKRSQSIPRNLHHHPRNSYTPLKAFKQNQQLSIAQIRLMQDYNTNASDSNNNAPNDQLQHLRSYSQTDEIRSKKSIVQQKDQYEANDEQRIMPTQSASQIDQRRGHQQHHFLPLAPSSSRNINLPQFSSDQQPQPIQNQAQDDQNQESANRQQDNHQKQLSKMQQNRSPQKSNGNEAGSGSKKTTHKLQVSLTPAENQVFELNTFSQSFPINNVNNVAVNINEKPQQQQSIQILNNEDVLKLPEQNNRKQIIDEQYQKMLTNKNDQSKQESIEYQKLLLDENTRQLGLTSTKSPVRITAMKLQEQSANSHESKLKPGGFRGNRGNNSNLKGNLDRQKLYRLQMEQIAKQKARELREKRRIERKNYKPYIPMADVDSGEEIDDGSRGRRLDNVEQFHGLLENDNEIFSQIEQPQEDDEY